MPRPTHEDVVSESTAGVRHHAYWALLLALIPLAMYTFWRDDVEARFEETFRENPDVAWAIQNDQMTDDDEIFAQLPDGRIVGAFLPHETSMHWLLALLSAGGFLGLLMLFSTGGASAGRLLAVGAFTGIVGIFVLLAFQWVAFATLGVWFRGRGIIVILFYLVKFIGFSYYCAINPDFSFWPSFFGFTFGVGLCEELVKAVPIVWYLHSDDDATWRTAGIVGLASGVGFGVSEGITYSADMYNGVSTGGIYAVRFISCVALHAIWASTVALLMFRNQDFLSDIDVGDVFWFVVAYLGIPMVLHGLYDVLLKSEMPVAALAVAGISFAGLAFMIERSRLDFGHDSPNVGYA